MGDCVLNTLTLSAIDEAYERIHDVVHRTPIIRNHSLAEIANCDLVLKAENLQRTGSFKIRGAFNKTAQVYEAGGSGVVTGSSGNHGAATAWAARYFKLHSHLVLPENAMPEKVEAARHYGADIEFLGTTSQERLERAQAISHNLGLSFTAPFDAPDVMAGQGTIGLEILHQLPEVEFILVPVGGGGLIAGIATAIKGKRPDVRVIGVEPVGAPKAYQSRQQGRRIVLKFTDTIADGLKTSSLGEKTYPIIERLVDDIVQVDDNEIRRAMFLLLSRQKMLAEPSGAATLAYALRKPNRLHHRKTVAVISGGNIDAATLFHLFDSYASTS